MKLPFSLITAFFDVPLSPIKLGETLTLLGIEVDHIQNSEPPFANVVVGEIVKVNRHPHAEKLQIAEVSDGKKRYSVVCGASNCRTGIKTAFARVGAILTDAQGKHFTIEKAVLRDVESMGMLCSAKELAISSDDEGIIELPLELDAGTDLTPLLWDPIFEISLTPNLGHCMSALGLAREISASLQIPLHVKRPPTFATLPPTIKVHVEDVSLAPRYTCRMVENVTVNESSFWVKKQLAGCGQKSINNVVDWCNLLMFTYGQPFHAFDADLIEGKELHVVRNKKNATFLGLDGNEYSVPLGAILIADAKKPLAIAGIMGGANSAVSKNTKRLLLEAAYFHPPAIRNASKKLSLRTESSQRFEKGVDPVFIPHALSFLAHAISGKISEEIDIKKDSFLPKKIAYRPARINQLLGTDLSQNEMEDIFRRLQFKVENTTVEVPVYRFDISEEIDLAEEVARIYGYNNIEKSIPSCTTSGVPNDPMYVFEMQVRTLLKGFGFAEFIHCDLISPKMAERQDKSYILQAKYAKSADYSILRTSLLPGLLQSAKRNKDHKRETIHAFEVGRIHLLEKGKVQEMSMCAILLCGKATPAHWSEKGKEVDFFDAKGVVETFCSAIHLRNVSFTPSISTSFHPGRQASILLQDQVIGSLGEIHPDVAATYDLRERVVYVEMSLDDMAKLRTSKTVVKPLALFPASERDWTISLEQKKSIGPLLAAIYALKLPLLEKVELLDLYVPLDSQQKNATFRFTYRDPLKTISFEEAEAAHQKMTSEVNKSLAK